MNILPKNYSQFKEKSYWNNFFDQLKNTTQQNFEWYGNYFDFKEQLKKIFKHLIHKNSQIYTKNIKTQQKPLEQNPKSQGLSIFHIGCGKSIFGQDIQLQYPQFKVINTDYSEIIVKDMIKRSLMMKTMCKYEVCDMFEPLQEKYQQMFNVILDKGTLDAIFPEDIEDQIANIKNVFFKNVQSAMNKNTYSAYVVVSMLQPFVLRTILQHFFCRQGYEVQIQQAKIQKSKMQPFLIVIKRSPLSQRKTSQTITFKLLKGNKQLTFTSIQQTMKHIEKLQETLASQQKIKKTVQYQNMTYNITSHQEPDKIRYTMQIIDNEEAKLKQNTCAVFIVPQGKQNSYMFCNSNGLRKLVRQIGTSRVILFKLMSGNVFSSIHQVKTQIDPLIKDFVQQGCDLKSVPVMTDAEELGVRKTIFKDQNLYIQEILCEKQQTAIRQVILKNNLSMVQSQCRLIYGKIEEYPGAKEAQKITKILPAKKSKYIVIDQESLDEEYCQKIVTGLVRFLKVGQSYQKGNNVMMLGGGGHCISKFLIENLYPSPNIVTVDRQKSLCLQQNLQLFEVLKYVKSQQLTVINDDAQHFIYQSDHKRSYSAIIVDISASEQQEVPPKQFLTSEFVKKCSQLIDSKQGGLLVFNIIKRNFITKELLEIISLKLFDLVYVARDWDEDIQEKKHQKQGEFEDDLVLYMIKLGDQLRTNLNNEASKLAAYAEELLAGSRQKKKGKNSKQLQEVELRIKDQSWVDYCSSQIRLIYPVNKTSIQV